MHGFFVDFERKNIRFDMVVDFAPDRKDVFEAAISEVKEKYPDYNIVANMDSDYSD